MAHVLTEIHIVMKKNSWQDDEIVIIFCLRLNGVGTKKIALVLSSRNDRPVRSVDAVRTRVKRTIKESFPEEHDRPFVISFIRGLLRDMDIADDEIPDLVSLEHRALIGQ